MFETLPEKIIGSAFLAFFFAAFALYHFMVFRVNKHLVTGEKFPHSLSFGQRDRLRDLYSSLYPRSPAYQFTMICAVALILLALLFAGLRVWGAAKPAVHVDLPSCTFYGTLY